MIEKYSKAEFEAALPKDKTTEAPLWSCLGCESGQYVYRVKPFKGDYTIIVWSAIDGSGYSSADAGGDSIRACIEKNESPFGGKSVRWIDRRKGWAERLTNSLRRLANQILHLRQGCPKCKKELVPLTSNTEKNKLRPFVKCNSCDYFAWTETPAPERNMIPPPAAKPVQTPVKEREKPKDAVELIRRAFEYLNEKVPYEDAAEGNELLYDLNFYLTHHKHHEDKNHV